MRSAARIIGAIAGILAFHGPSMAQETDAGFIDGPVKIAVSATLGYGMVNMQEINAAIREVGTIRQAADPQGEASDLLVGGFYWDASAVLRWNRFLAGVGVSFLETSGQSTYDQGFFLSDELTGKATELFVLAGIRIPSEGPLFLDLLAGGGVSMATMDYAGEFRDYFDPSQHIQFNHSLENNFFSARILATAGFLIGPLSILATAGYRFADAGVMTGTTTLNGQTSSQEKSFVDFRGREISFDFSGLILGGGLSVEF